MLRGTIFGAGVTSALLITSLAGATPVTGTITADNHYSIYSVNGQGQLVLEGGNELGADGAPGNYNWSLPETFTFDTNQVFYIGAWSDDFYAQGLLAEFQITGGPTIRTGDAGWQVFSTGMDRDDFAPGYPSAAEVTAQIAIANGPPPQWQTPFVGGNNGVGPWGVIPGISTQARWIWANPDNLSNPLEPGYNAGEYIIFCVPIPTPGTIALAGVGMLAALRRKR
jgi:hypothetical protein